MNVESYVETSLQSEQPQSEVNRDFEKEIEALDFESKQKTTEITDLKAELKWVNELNDQKRLEIKELKELIGKKWSAKHLWLLTNLFLRRRLKSLYIGFKNLVDQRRCADCRRVRISTRRRQVKDTVWVYPFCSNCAEKATVRFGLKFLELEAQ